MTASDNSRLRELIRDIPDFPQQGIMFKDITPILADPAALCEAVKAVADPWRGKSIDLVAGVESRGFILGAPVALELGAGFVPVRKMGKLPARTISAEYELEYGRNVLEMHEDAVRPGQNVLIIDDLLATGGTAGAVIEMIEQLGGVVAGIGFLVELAFLGARAKLTRHPLMSVITF